MDIFTAWIWPSIGREGARIHPLNSINQITARKSKLSAFPTLWYTHIPVNQAEHQEKVPYLSRHNFLIDLDWLISKEWWVTSSHFIDENSQGPPINSLVVPLEGKYFKLGALAQTTSQHDAKQNFWIDEYLISVNPFTPKF